jgi:phosphoribosylanthranilate isomerase
MFIKICGITSITDARMVAAAGAQAIGLNFYADSPRAVQMPVAHEIIQNLPPFVEAVGLFVNTPPAEARNTANALGLRTVQVHGQVTPELVSDLRDFSVIAAFSLRDADSVLPILNFVSACQNAGRLPSAILVDAHSDGKFGGTGQTAPWAIARNVVEQCRVPVMLAGGLTTKNVTAAIRTVQPWGVDVASGVEVAPGRKESYKVKSFIDAARRATIQAR